MDLNNALITTELFKEYYPDDIFYVLSTAYDYNGGHRMVSGLNVSKISYPTHAIYSYVYGGIKIYNLELLAKAFSYEYGKEYISKVTLPSDTQIYIEDKNFVVDKCIVLEKVKLNESDIWNIKEFADDMYKINPKLMLKMKPLDTLSDDDIMKLIEADPFSIDDIKHPSEKVRRFAITKNPYIIRTMNDLTDDDLVFALNINPSCFRQMRSPQKTYNICMVAVSKDGILLSDVPHKFMDEEMALTAIFTNPMAIKYYHQKTEAFIDKALLVNPNIIEHIYIPNLTIESWKIALNKNGLLLKEVPLSHPCFNELQEIAFNNNVEAIQHISKPTQEMIRKIMQSHPKLLSKLHPIVKIEDCLYEGLDDEQIIGIVKEQPNKITKFKNLNNKTLNVLISENPMIVTYDYPFTNDEFKYAIAMDPNIIYKLQNPSNELCEFAFDCEPELMGIKQADELLFGLSDEVIDRIIINALSKNGMLMKFITKQCEKKEYQIQAVMNNPDAIRHITNQCEEACWISLSKNPELLDYIIDPTIEMQVYATNLNPVCSKYIDDKDKEQCRQILFTLLLVNPKCVLHIVDPDMKIKAIEAMSGMDAYVFK